MRAFAGTAGLAALAMCVVFGVRVTTAAADSLIIGTGSTSGVYYQVGRAICHLIERRRTMPGTRCRAVPTAGSIFNLQNLRAGRLQLGVVQSDWQYHAVEGSGPFVEDGPDAKLRAVFSVHGEPFTLVARRDSGIRRLQDLPGKRVNIGNPGSGQRATMEVVMAAMGWDKRTFSLADELPASQQSLALCHDRVQAMVYTVGHPNASVAQALGICKASIVEVSGPEIDRLVAENPYYAKTEVSPDIYTGNPAAVRTFGVKATVLASADVDTEMIYAVVKTVFDNFETFKGMHPAFGSLTPEQMITDGLSAPLHFGARRYFVQQGLIVGG